MSDTHSHKVIYYVIIVFLFCSYYYTHESLELQWNQFAHPCLHALAHALLEGEAEGAVAQQQVNSSNEWHHSRYAIEDEKKYHLIRYLPEKHEFKYLIRCRCYANEITP